ncbi:unnamed protein product, partial [marine sediment metagenome]
ETGYFIFSIPRANLSEMTFGLEHQFKTLEKNLQNKIHEIKLNNRKIIDTLTKQIFALANFETEYVCFIRSSKRIDSSTDSNFSLKSLLVV